jgi:imidazolonepropionase
MNMNMSPEEVLVATTLNAAHAINQGDKIGSIEAGKQADLAIFNVSSYRTLQYQYGLNHIDCVVKKGEVVVENGKVL